MCLDVFLRYCFCFFWAWSRGSVFVQVVIGPNLRFACTLKRLSKCFKRTLFFFQRNCFLSRQEITCLIIRHIVWLFCWFNRFIYSGSILSFFWWVTTNNGAKNKSFNIPPQFQKSSIILVGDISAYMCHKFKFLSPCYCYFFRLIFRRISCTLWVFIFLVNCLESWAEYEDKID